MGRRNPNPYNSAKHNAQELPFIRGSKVLLAPEVVAKMKHIAKPWRGDQTLAYDENLLGHDEPYVDVNLMFLALLNEVIHLRKQIGLVCEGTYLATNGNFHVPIRSTHVILGNEKIDREPIIEDFCIDRSKK